MATPPSPYRADDRQESVGDLVALAAAEIAQLVKCELDLAKTELKEDAREVAVGAALLAVAVFTVCLVLFMLCFAFAYGLMATGIPFISWPWAAFTIVAITCVLLVLGALAIARAKFGGLNGLRRTRGTIAGGLAMLRARRAAGKRATRRPRRAEDG